MTHLPFDPSNPPEEPPAQVAQPMMWRMAVRLVTDHRPDWSAVGRARPPCRCCGDSWPCRGHELGRRGLVASLRDPGPFREPDSRDIGGDG
jgi:hypothetical protein